MSTNVARGISASRNVVDKSFDFLMILQMGCLKIIKNYNKMINLCF